MNFYNEYTDHLLRCDLINKYNLKTLNQIPKIDQIELELPFDQIASTFTKNEKRFDICQIQSFLVWYLFSTFTPNILINKSAEIKSARSIKVIFSKKESIFNFIIFFLVENAAKLRAQNVDFFKHLYFQKQNERLILESKINKKFTAPSQFILAVNAPLRCFDELENLSIKYIKKSDVKKLNVKINFSIRIKPSLFKKNTLKNLPLLWLIK